MNGAAPLPVVRLKIPCADGREFLEKLAGRFVQNGIFVPTGHPRPVGSRIHLKLEFRDGTVGVSGSALVTGQGTFEKPGMVLRFTALHPESIQFDLSPLRLPARPPPVVPKPAPAAGGGLADQLFGSGAEGDEPLGSPRPLEVRTSAVRLKLRETSRQPDPRAAGPAEESGRPIPQVPAHPQAAAAEPDVAEPDAVEAGAAEADTVDPDAVEPAAAEAPPSRGAVPARAMRVGVAAAVLALGMAVAAGLAVAGTFASRRSAERLEAEMQAADASMRQGKLVRPAGDSALDHLLAARDLSPADERPARRLKALADTFEQLGFRAAAKGELREAAFHLEAAVRADPGRARAVQKLHEVQARLAAEGSRAR